MTDFKVDSLVNQLKEMVEKKRDKKEERKKEEEMMQLFDKNINIILKRDANEYCKGYNIFNVKILLNLLLKIIKKQSKDIQELKDKN